MYSSVNSCDAIKISAKPSHASFERCLSSTVLNTSQASTVTHRIGQRSWRTIQTVAVAVVGRRPSKREVKTSQQMRANFLSVHMPFATRSILNVRHPIKR